LHGSLSLERVSFAIHIILFISYMYVIIILSAYRQKGPYLVMSILGEYITAQRTAKNLSKHKLVDLTHLRHPEIYRLKTGERKKPSPFTLQSLAKTLGLKFAEIMHAKKPTKVKN